MGVLFALVTALCFALSNVHNRKASRRVTGEEAIAFNLGLSALIFFPASLLIKVLSGTAWPDRQGLILFALVGVLSVCLGRWGLFNAIAHVGPSRASAMKNANPAFAVLLGLLVFGRLPSALGLAGITAILLGIGLLGREKNPHTARPLDGRGLAMGLGVAFIFASGDIVRALSMQRLPDPILAAGVSALVGWILLLVILGARGHLISVHRRLRYALDPDVVLATIWSGLGQITNFVAVKTLFVPYAVALIATAPLLTAACSFLLSRHDEHFGPSFWTSAGLLVMGAGMISLFR